MDAICSYFIKRLNFNQSKSERVTVTDAVIVKLFLMCEVLIRCSVDHGVTCRVCWLGCCTDVLHSCKTCLLFASKTNHVISAVTKKWSHALKHKQTFEKKTCEPKNVFTCYKRNPLTPCNRECKNDSIEFSVEKKHLAYFLCSSLSIWEQSEHHQKGIRQPQTHRPAFSQQRLG